MTNLLTPTDLQSADIDDLRDLLVAVRSELKARLIAAAPAEITIELEEADPGETLEVSPEYIERGEVYLYYCGKKIRDIRCAGCGKMRSAICWGGWHCPECHNAIQMGEDPLDY